MKVISKLKIIALFLILSSTTSLLKPTELGNLTKSIFNEYKKQKNLSQTISHLSNPDISNKLKNLNYGFFGTNFNDKIQAVGKKNLEKLLSNAINSEITNNNKFVFYHAQNRNFLLYQDIHKKIIGEIFKKAISELILLRLPNKDSKTYKSVKDFLSKFSFQIDDSYEPFKSLLLSVNPSIFGNTAYNPSGESTFEYFLRAENANYVSHLNIIEDLFYFFDIKDIYNNYSYDIYNLYFLLSSHEIDKTGILLQILIDQNDVNNFVYEAKAWGKPKNVFGNNTINTLLDYKINADNYWLSAAFDKIQFRLLLNDDFQKNKNNQINRYYNKTKNIKLYKNSLKILVDKIKQDLKIEYTDVTKFSKDNLKSTFNSITEKLKTIAVN